MSDDEKKDYDVGYKRPPPQGQFKSGQSGNPRGRPKGSKNFSTEIENELNARVPITENGKRKKISKRKVIAKQLVNKAAGGDPKATSALLQHDRTIRGELASGIAPVEVMAEEDRRVMESVVGRLLQMKGLKVAAQAPAADAPEKSEPEQSKEGKQ